MAAPPGARFVLAGAQLVRVGRRAAARAGRLASYPHLPWSPGAHQFVARCLCLVPPVPACYRSCHCSSSSCRPSSRPSLSLLRCALCVCFGASRDRNEAPRPARALAARRPALGLHLAAGLVRARRRHRPRRVVHRPDRARRRVAFAHRRRARVVRAAIPLHLYPPERKRERERES